MWYVPVLLLFARAAAPCAAAPSPAPSVSIQLWNEFSAEASLVVNGRPMAPAVSLGSRGVFAVPAPDSPDGSVALQVQAVYVIRAQHLVSIPGVWW